MDTVHSDWGDWLPREVAAAEPDGLDAWYLGCNGFVLKAGDGTTLFVDPYCGTGSPPRTIRMVPVPFDPEDVREVDAVLATHEHSDHVHGPTQAPLVEQGATYHAPDDSLAVVIEEDWIEMYGLDADLFREVSEGDRFEVGGVTVHVEGATDPDASHPVSYVIEYDGRRFFHGGDGRPGAAFADVGERYDLHLGALAFGSSGWLRSEEDPDERLFKTWYADENEVVEAASQLDLDRLLPTHWDMWKGLTAEPAALHHHARTYDAPGGVEVLEAGDRVSV